MDGKGRFLDNIFIERLWRTLKYNCLYLHAWETGSEAKAGIRKCMTFYNHQRPHSALGGTPPAVVYWLRKDETQTDQQLQRVAQLTPETVQPMGSSSEVRRRIKMQTVLPAPETVPMLLWALPASGQIQMRKVDGRETLDQPLEPVVLDAAA